MSTRILTALTTVRTHTRTLTQAAIVAAILIVGIVAQFTLTDAHGSNRPPEPGTVEPASIVGAADTTSTAITPTPTATTVLNASATITTTITTTPTITSPVSPTTESVSAASSETVAIIADATPVPDSTPVPATVEAPSPALPPPPPPVTTATDTLYDHIPQLYAAEARYNLPSGIMSAIAWRESSFGAQACGYNAWGVGACRGYNYSSWDEGIEDATALFAHWVSVRGNVADALCTWVSGQTCAVSGAWYASEVDALLTTKNLIR